MTPFLDAAALARLEALHREATPGPWRQGREDMQSYDAYTGEAEAHVYADNPKGKLHMGERLPFVIAKVTDESGRNKEDARLIAEMRNALAALLAEVRAHREYPACVRPFCRMRDAYKTWRDADGTLP